MLCIITVVLFITQLFIVSSFSCSIIRRHSVCGVVRHAGQGCWLVGHLSLGHLCGCLLCGCHVADSNVASPVRGWSEKAHAGLLVLAQTLDSDDVVHRHHLPLHHLVVHFAGSFIIRCSAIHCPVVGRLVWGPLIIVLH